MTRSNNSRSLRSFSAHSAARLLLTAMIALAVTTFAASNAHAQRRTSSSRTTSTTTTASYQTTQQHVTFGGELALPYMFASFGTASLSGIGLHIAAVADIPVAAKTGILATAGYESKHGSGSLSQSGTSVDMALTLNYFELGGMVRHDITENISLQGGLALQFSAGGSNLQVTAHSGSASAKGEVNGELSMPTQVALVAGVGYRVRLSQTMELVPSASFHFSVTSPTPDGNSSAHTLMIGARLMFN